MPAPRDVLHHLTRDELAGAAERHGVAVRDRRSKEQLVEGLAASDGVTLGEILAPFARDRLKALCRALGLDDGGREKAALVGRITAEGADTAPPASPKKASRGANGLGDAVEIPTGEKLTTDRLERYLWSAADILRGSIDSNDYTQCPARTKSVPIQGPDECRPRPRNGLLPADIGSIPTNLPYVQIQACGDEQRYWRDTAMCEGKPE